MAIDGLMFLPRDGKAEQQLAQQLVCHYGAENVGTGVAMKLYFTVRREACEEIGAPPFTALGEAITCPAEGDSWVAYNVIESDVPPLNINGCTPIVEPLPVPGGLAAGAVTATTVALSWSASTGATQYHVQYRRVGTTAWLDFATGTTGTSITVTGLTGNTDYEFRVKATGADGAESPYTAPVTAKTAGPLPVPTGLATGTATATTMPLTWATVTGATKYHVQYKKSADATWIDFGTEPTGGSTTVTGLEADTGYDFKVKAMSADNESPYTAVVSGTTAAA